MKEFLEDINLHIKNRKLTHKLFVVSDGDNYYCVYESTFNPQDTVDIVGQLRAPGITYLQLKYWTDKIIDSPVNI